MYLVHSPSAEVYPERYPGPPVCESHALVIFFRLPVAAERMQLDTRLFLPLSKNPQQGLESNLTVGLTAR